MKSLIVLLAVAVCAVYAEERAARAVSYAGLGGVVPYSGLNTYGINSYGLNSYGVQGVPAVSAVSAVPAVSSYGQYSQYPVVGSVGSYGVGSYGYGYGVPAVGGYYGSGLNYASGLNYGYPYGYRTLGSNLLGYGAH